MITDDKHWNILISHVLQMKRRDWINSSDFVTIDHVLQNLPYGPQNQCYNEAPVYINVLQMLS